MKKVFITGMSGTGKSTLANLLKERGYNTIDVDHVQGMCGWRNKITGEKAFVPEPDNKFISEHDYKCDMTILESIMQKHTGHVFVFGSVGDNSEFIPLFDSLILLQCNPDTLIYRPQNRDNNIFGKVEEVQTSILEWKKRFDALMIEAGAVIVNTERELTLVADEVEEFEK